MTIHPYIGNGPYCYSNTLLTALGHPDLSLSTLETLTGSPFGFQLLFGELPLFDPLGWDPGLGVDQALTLLGYTWQTHSLADEAEALAFLQEELNHGPVFVGPVDMGLLQHQPESDRASGADHFVTVLEITDALVFMHDPQGHPWTALPPDLFLQAWKAEHVGYARPFTLRHSFQQEQEVAPLDAVRESLPLALRWLQGRDELDLPPGTIGGSEGLHVLADQIATNFSDDLRNMLIHFGIRVGARRKADAALTLSSIGEVGAADVLQKQARTLGALQYPAMSRDTPTLVDGLRKLADLHEQLQQILVRISGEGLS